MYLIKDERFSTFDIQDEIKISLASKIKNVDIGDNIKKMNIYLVRHRKR